MSKQIKILLITFSLLILLHAILIYVNIQFGGAPECLVVGGCPPAFNIDPLLFDNIIRWVHIIVTVAIVLLGIFLLRGKK